MPSGVYLRSKFHRERISEGLLGHKGTSFNHTEEAKKKISQSLIGNKRSTGRIPWNKNQSMSEETRLKLSLGSRGEKTWNYLDGSSLKRGSDWKWIKRKIKERDNYICQSCGVINKILQIHHIVPWETVRENHPLNLITLCISCHRRIESGSLCLLVLPINLHEN
jgi:hypothetical protein